MDDVAGARPSIRQLILIPTLITLAITLVRLAGELQHWSKAFFNPEAGGPWSIIGITWLAFAFGAYFAVKLAPRNLGSVSLLRAGAVAIAGWAVLFGSQILVRRLIFPHYGFKATLVVIWLMWTFAGVLQFAGWPELCKVLLAYAYAARVPVTIVMFLAFQGRWGTHYDALPPGWQSAGLWHDFFWLGFFPQLTLWIGFTLAAGMLFGVVAAAIVRLVRRKVLVFP